MKRCSICQSTKLTFTGYLIYYYVNKHKKKMVWVPTHHDILVEQYTCANGHSSKKAKLELPVEDMTNTSIFGFQLQNIKGEFVEFDLKINWDNTLGPIKHYSF